MSNFSNVKRGLGPHPPACHDHHDRSERPHRRTAVAASIRRREARVLGRERLERGGASQLAAKTRVPNCAVGIWRTTRIGEPVTERGKNSFGRDRHDFGMEWFMVPERVEDAANWYESHGFRLRSNCMVTGNPCVPTERSHRPRRNARICSPDTVLQFQDHWSDQCVNRFKRCPNVAICEALCSNVPRTSSRMTKFGLRCFASFNATPRA